MIAGSLNIYFFKNTLEKTEKLRLIILLLFTFSLPYDLFYSSVIFIILCATTLLDLNKQKLKDVPKQIWIFQLVYFLGVAGYFYSLNKNEAGFLLERQLTILLLPLILPLAVKIDDHKLKLVLTALTTASLLAVCYLFISMSYTILSTQTPFIKTMFSGAFFNHQFSKPLTIHAGYLSMYIAVSVFYTVQLVNSTKSVLLKAPLILALIVLFAGLFFLASRNTIITVFFVILVIFPFFKIKHKLRYMLVSILSLAICFFVIISIPYLKERFISGLITDITPLQNSSYSKSNTVEPRGERWIGAVDLIKKSPAYGYGTGDERDLLKTEYMRRGLYISYMESFNAHNQYLSYLLKNGILGLCIFLFAFYYYLKLAIRHKDFMYLAFLVLLLIGFYTENILDANKGIIFFALFNTFFGYNCLLNLKQQDVISEVNTN